MKTPSASNRVLNVKVGESLHQAAARAAATMRAVQRGEPISPYFGVSFEQIGQMLAAFTPKRWELIAALRESGPLTVAGLARQLGRNYKNVHTDVAQLIEWMAVERCEDGRVCVPWSEIVVGMKLPERVAA
jgi:predicted transcriptional regulator